MAVQPDIQGFRDAMNSMRALTGQDVTFHVPIAPVWPPGTALDENGQPYDATVVPSSGGGTTDIVKRVGVVSPIVTRRAIDDVRASEQGVVRTNHVVLDVAVADIPDIANATTFTMHGVLFQITDTITDGLIGDDRLLVFGGAL